jgi:hypothetical protein
MGDSLRVIHNQLVPTGTGFTFTSPTNFTGTSTKAFKDIPAAGTDFTFSSPSLTTYQVLVASTGGGGSSTGTQTLSPIKISDPTYNDILAPLHNYLTAVSSATAFNDFTSFVDHSNVGYRVLNSTLASSFIVEEAYTPLFNTYHNPSLGYKTSFQIASGQSNGNYFVSSLDTDGNARVDSYDSSFNHRGSLTLSDGTLISGDGLTIVSIFGGFRLVLLARGKVYLLDSSFNPTVLDSYDLYNNGEFPTSMSVVDDGIVTIYVNAGTGDTIKFTVNPDLASLSSPTVYSPSPNYFLTCIAAKDRSNYYVFNSNDITIDRLSGTVVQVQVPLTFDPAHTAIFAWPLAVYNDYVVFSLTAQDDLSNPYNRVYIIQNDVEIAYFDLPGIPVGEFGDADYPINSNRSPNIAFRSNKGFVVNELTAEIISFPLTVSASAEREFFQLSHSSASGFGSIVYDDSTRLFLLNNADHTYAVRYTEAAGFNESSFAVVPESVAFEQTTIEEGINLLDLVTPVASSNSESTETDAILVYDSMAGEYTSTTITEYIDFGDSISAESNEVQDASFSGTVIVSIRESYDATGTTLINIREAVDASFSTQITIQEQINLPAASVTNPDNPLQPTYIANGSVVYSHSDTLPSVDLSKVRCYLAMKCGDIVGDQGAQDIFNFNITINGGNNTWSSNTLEHPGVFFDEIQVLGLPGSILRQGFSWSNSSAGVTDGGLLGTYKLNKELGYLTYGNPYFFYNVPNPSLKKPATLRAKTYGAAVQMIASLAGVSVTWGIPDQPLTDFQPQMSQTALSAIESLASDAGGGVLRWLGGTKYIIKYPDEPIGGVWEVPDCCLITAFEKECVADINTGKYVPGIYAVPQLAQKDYGTLIKDSVAPEVSSDPTTGGASLIAEDLWETNVLITSESAPRFVELPFDYNTIYVHNVASTDGEGVYTTLDPHRLWPLPTGSFGKYINNLDIGGVLKPVFIPHPDLFPQDNTDAQEGGDKWYFKAYVTRNPVGGGSNANNNGASDTETRTVLRNKFIPTCTFSISAVFFGSIPLPGMTARATINGETIEGTIESVNVSNLGITVSGVNWSRLQYYQQLSEVTSAG